MLKNEQNGTSQEVDFEEVKKQAGLSQNISAESLEANRAKLGEALTKAFASQLPSDLAAAFVPVDSDEDSEEEQARGKRLMQPGGGSGAAEGSRFSDMHDRRSKAKKAAEAKKNLLLENQKKEAREEFEKALNLVEYAGLELEKHLSALQEWIDVPGFLGDEEAAEDGTISAANAASDWKLPTRDTAVSPNDATGETVLSSAPAQARVEDLLDTLRSDLNDFRAMFLAFGGEDEGSLSMDGEDDEVSSQVSPERGEPRLKEKDEDSASPEEEPEFGEDVRSTTASSDEPGAGTTNGGQADVLRKENLPPLKKLFETQGIMLALLEKVQTQRTKIISARGYVSTGMKSGSSLLSKGKGSRLEEALNAIHKLGVDTKELDKFTGQRDLSRAKWEQIRVSYHFQGEFIFGCYETLIGRG